ncbi:MAG TPA: alanine--tRNA ligase, partial [Alphaproteobacteria bacterium]|nr:alanine--tRNA ligase [Alphaproteobacteria bacterium]
MTSLSDIRSAFLGYFEQHGHEAVASSPLVPRNDPTLLFTNAGMVQFKNVFTGAEKRSKSRAATAQKCLRAGGKHNDLDNVGYTARHHTFFEMLGNFSFGDYFKEEAITLAWDLVSKTFALPTDRLLVTVYSEDDEAFGLWRKIAGFPEQKIIRIPTSDNFWSMGETGPCGPCSEIFFDYGPTVQGGPPGSPDADGDRYVEFWNLVFMQYEQVSKTERVALPKPSIDTGMGLERIASILQGKTDNYDTDLFRLLIEASAAHSGARAEGPHAVSHRVIADHLRASSFLIADGVLPSNEGRGYVLRRIMRRAMRHAHILGAKDPLMHRLAPVLITAMAQAYPELTRAQALIVETLRLEETRFRETLERGLKLLDEEVARLNGSTLAGDVAFKLYDTYGFPVDLTQDALRARGLSLDMPGFDQAMARQKAEARKSWAGSGEAQAEHIWFGLRDQLGATEFLGYETEAAEGVITALIYEGLAVDRLEAGQTGFLLVNQTPFYAESGGQAGDQGALFTKDGAEGEVVDTQKRAGTLHVHDVKVGRGTLRTGDTVDLRVDHGRRTATRANHSATHLLHEALRRALGEHVTQKGSLVAHDRLRFDFSHPKALSEQEVDLIEAMVNRQIRLNAAVSTRLMTLEAAIEAGAMALFGEKYGDEVRVLSMGAHEGSQVFSTELCGGTHVERTGDIGLFKIIAEQAVASGVRRIEALTGEGALLHLTQQDKALAKASLALRVQPGELAERVVALVEERKRLERELADAKRQLAMGGGTAVAAPVADDVGGVKVLSRILEGVEAKDLRALIDQAKTQIGSGVIVFGMESEGKASLAIGVTPDLTQRFDAVALIKAGVEVLGGKGGGGRPDMAQA